MGIEYWLIDKSNKTFYDLGKGGWLEFNYDKECFQDLEYLTAYILEDVWNLDERIQNGTYSTDEGIELKDYIKNQLAPDLYNLFSQSKPEDLVVVNDCGDDFVICKAKKYKCVGTRFYFDDPKKRSEEINYNNKHLEDTDLNKRWYNPDDYKKYPEWEKY